MSNISCSCGLCDPCFKIRKLEQSKRLAESIAPGSYWKHKNGYTYKVLCITNMKSIRAEYLPQVVYEGANGFVWSRPIGTWFESMEKYYG